MSITRVSTAEGDSLEDDGERRRAQNFYFCGVRISILVGITLPFVVLHSGINKTYGISILDMLRYNDEKEWSRCFSK